MRNDSGLVLTVYSCALGVCKDIHRTADYRYMHEGAMETGPFFFVKKKVLRKKRKEKKNQGNQLRAYMYMVITEQCGENGAKGTASKLDPS